MQTNKIPNRQAICEVLMENALQDKQILVLCSDSRGSASMVPFASAFPEQFIEVGIAEQNLVSVAAGLANGGKKPFAVSPACFLSTRSFEQIKVDVAYSKTNVKLVGISGGISYGSLGMTHHSAQDIAAISAIPSMRIYLPSDRVQTKKLFEHLIDDEKPAYIRVGRNAIEDIYDENHAFVMDRANVLRDGIDVAIIACGEMVQPAICAADILNKSNIMTSVIDMYCIKPIDKQAVLEAARSTKVVFTLEEHSPFGGLGAIVSQIISKECPKRVVNLSLPDEPIISGTPSEVFRHYGLDAQGIAKTVRQVVQGV